MLDGGWWPESWDPVVELPGLVLALSDRYGQIRQLMLNRATWSSQPHRLILGAAVIRLGWFASLDPAVLVATTYTGDQVDILVVPPRVAPEDASLVMTAAADPADTRRASELLAAFTAPAPDPDGNTDPNAVWDNEGGRISTARPGRPLRAVATAISSH